MISNCRRHKDGQIEEQKSHASLQKDMMEPEVHFDPTKTSAPMVDRIVASMSKLHSVQMAWTLEHIDIKSAFLSERYKFPKPVNIR